MILFAAVTVWTFAVMWFDDSPTPLTKIHVGNAVLLGTALLLF